MKKIIEMKPVSRRHAMAMMAAAGVVSAVSLPVLADAAAVAEKIKSVTGGAAVGDGTSITLDVPEIAENGNAVKVAFEIDSPMTADDHVRAVHIFADGNPTPEVAAFNFSPAVGACGASTRMRLAKTQNIVVLASMSDGSFQKAEATIKVTIGGCGG